jgi:hypothetical protein
MPSSMFAAASLGRMLRADSILPATCAPITVQNFRGWAASFEFKLRAKLSPLVASTGTGSLFCGPPFCETHL